MSAKDMRIGDRAAPRRQHNWDWRAASNFIAGGTGGGLLVFAALAHLAGADARPLIAAGMAFVAAGLACVWFEIGRPWRALNVYRHLATSWMTREAAIAPVLFASGAAAVAIGGTGFVLLAGAAGAAFVYAQARILSADKGIPAWRHPRCRPLVVATGLVEGAAIVAGASPALLPHAAGQVAAAAVLLALLLVRALAWRGFRLGLAADGAPAGSLDALAAIETRVLVFGTLAPALLLTVAVLFAPGAWLAMAVAAAFAVGAGWLVKYTLVRRAAFTQGFALKHLPVRGRGPAGAAVKPGW